MKKRNKQENAMELVLDNPNDKIKEFIRDSYHIDYINDTNDIPIHRLIKNPQNYRSGNSQYILSFTNTDYERSILCIYNNKAYIAKKPFNIYYLKTEHKSNMCVFEVETNEDNSNMYITDCIRYNNHDISNFNYAIRMKIASMFKDIPTRPYFYTHQNLEVQEFCSKNNITNFKLLYIPLINPVAAFENPFIFTLT
jgi:hypothetical protein